MRIKTKGKDQGGKGLGKMGKKKPSEIYQTAPFGDWLSYYVLTTRKLSNYLVRKLTGIN